MRRPPLPALLLALVLGLLSSFAVACGEEERGRLLSATRAQDLKDGLNDVDEAVADGSCTRVREELDGLRTQLSELPRDTDAELRDRLEEGIAHLEEIAPGECEEQETPKTQTETQPETTTETQPPVETQPQPTQTAPTQTQPTPTQPAPDDGTDDGTPDDLGPGNGNGNGPPGGTPPGQSGGSQGPEGAGIE